MPPSIPVAKRALRRIARLLPPFPLFFGLGKAFTRTLVRPLSGSRPTRFEFGRGLMLEADLGEFVGNDLYCLDHHFESATLAVWRELARSATTVLDLGAHVGLFSLIAARENPRARVFAIEADPDNLVLLRRNAETFAGIRAVDALIAPEAGTYPYRRRPLSGGGAIDLASVARASTSGDPGEAGAAQMREGRPLSDLVAEIGLTRIDLMKMDLEGLEHALLLGQERFWRETPPAQLIVEIGVPRSRPEDLDRLRTAMRERGYASKRLQSLYALPCTQSEDLANWWFWREAPRVSAPWD